MSDDVSWQSPNRKDVHIEKHPLTGEKQEFPKKYLTMTISEVYAVYCKSHSTTTVGKSTFFDLRPPHVLPLSDMPHNVCTCVYHENFKFLISSLQSQNILQFPGDERELLEKVYCQVDNESCMLNRCKNCKGIGFLFSSVEISGTVKILFRQWVYQEKEILTKDKKQTKKVSRLVLRESEMTLLEIINLLQEKLEKFKTHYYVYKQQSQSFHGSIINVAPDTIILQVNFSEKFTIKFQDEAQSAYYNQHQISIFTCCAWSTTEKQCYGVLSDCITQDKFMVWLCLEKIMQNLKENCPNLKKLKIFSDGAGSQIKNKFTLTNLINAFNDYGFKISWEFMATSHGKEAIDGIGAVLKQKLWSAIRSRKIILKDAQDCHRYLQEHIQGIKTILAEEEELETIKKKLKPRWENVRSILNVKKSTPSKY